MRYLWTQPVESEQGKALHARGLVYHHKTPEGARKDKREACSNRACWRLIDPANAIDLGVVGRFCSADCAQIGSEDHERYMSRIAKLREEIPWVYETKEK